MTTVREQLECILSPAQLTGNQNDYDPGLLPGYRALRLTSDADRNITGIVSDAFAHELLNGAGALLICNVGSYNITLKNQDAGSAAANRFALNADLVIKPGGACMMAYDSTSTRWRVIGQSDVGTSGGGGTTSPANISHAKPYTTSPAPHSSYADDEIDNSTTAATAFATFAGRLTDGWIGGPTDFTLGYLAWNNQNPVIRVDLGAAHSVSKLRVWGQYGSDLIYRPIGIKVEYSDDDSTWTQVENRTGLTGGGQPGRRHWLMEVDCSAAGSHRYWRATLTRDTANAWTFVSEIELYGAA